MRIIALSFAMLFCLAQASAITPFAKIVGVGIQADLNESNQLIILGMVEGAPAALSGEIAIGDQVIAVKSNSRSTMIDITNMTLEEIGPMFRGEEGEAIFLKMRREGTEDFIVELVRAEFEYEEE